MRIAQPFLKGVALASLYSLQALGYPASPENDELSNAFFNSSLSLDDAGDSTLVKRDEVFLRIMPLGASIVFGWGSSSGNGFRKPLRDYYRWKGHEVDMVGTKHGGNMVDWESEATPGFVVDQVHEASKLSYKFKPNVVVMNAGTNDCFHEIDLDNIGSRMRDLLEGLWDNISSDTVVILSTLLNSSNEKVRGYVRDIVNPAYRQLVKDLRSAGRPIYLADMAPPSDLDYIPLSLIKDGTHPNDEGHSRMAAAFAQALDHALSDGVVPSALDIDTGGDGGFKPGTGTPGDSGDPDDQETCKKVAGTGVYAGGLTQHGAGLDDGIYYHDSEAMGTILTITSYWDRDQWFFARLFSRERDDLVAWYRIKDDDPVKYAVWRNDGNGKFTKIDDMSVGDNCLQRGVVFIDLNADGLDDFACIARDGGVFASMNQGDGSGDKPPSFNRIGLIKHAEDGYPQDQVRLADIDGDGRADFCALSPNGDIHVWRNGWVDDMPAYWQSMGKRFSGKNMGDLNGVRFEDINGDGRDDWLWVSDDGQTTTWTNSRSCLKGKIGDGLNAAWRQGFHKGHNSGPTHFGNMGDGVRKRIFFARIYGEPQDFGLLGQQDYVYMAHSKDGDMHKFDIQVFKNTAHGGTKVLADGDKYCDMTGSGKDDYVWTLSKGDMTIYPNIGRTFITTESYWGPWAVIFRPKDIVGKHLDRRDLHLVDWDGDGKCDIVWTDPDNDNRVSVFINKYDGSDWKWDHHANPAPNVHCPEHRGIGIDDLAVRFGDITGNGRGDYLCLEKDGRVWGYTHEDDDSWTYRDQISFSKGKDRANLRFADFNGGGSDDMIWTDKFTGDGWVWYNLGRRDIAGSRYEWEHADGGGPAHAYAGNAAGTCTFYPDLDGNGRADQHIILGTWDNKAKTWYNTCDGAPGGGDSQNHQGDDGTVSDPNLPLPPKWEDYDDDDDDGWYAFCDAPDRSTTEKVRQFLYDSYTIGWLDSELGVLENGEKRWVDELWEKVIFPHEGKSGMEDCHKIGGTCAPPTKCHDYPRPEAYWVLTMVATLHSKLNSIRESLLWNGWLAGMSIEQISDDFTAPEPDSSWQQWVDVAFSLASAAAESTPGVGGMLGFASGAFSMASEQETDKVTVDKTSIQQTLKNMVGVAGDRVADILNNATGYGDPSMLPIYTSTTFRHPTARFFWDPSILLNTKSDNDTFIEALGYFGPFLEKKLVNLAMHQMFYLLLADMDVEKDYCNDRSPGARWLEADGESHCFYFTRTEEGSAIMRGNAWSTYGAAWLSPDSHFFNHFDNSMYDKIHEHYDIDITKLYESFIDCAVHGDGSVDQGAGVHGIPRCFYTLRVAKGFWGPTEKPTGAQTRSVLHFRDEY